MDWLHTRENQAFLNLAKLACQNNISLGLASSDPLDTESIKEAEIQLGIEKIRTSWRQRTASKDLEETRGAMAGEMSLATNQIKIIKSCDDAVEIKTLIIGEMES
jgi:hypothetical protein